MFFWQTTIDRGISSQGHDSTRLQTVSVHLHEVGRFNIPYHTRQIDELREVLFFHPIDIPKRIPLNTFAVMDDPENASMVIVTIEDRDGHFMERMNVRFLSILSSSQSLMPVPCRT